MVYLYSEVLVLDDLSLVHLHWGNTYLSKMNDDKNLRYKSLFL